jgi:cytochrome c
MKRMTLTRRNTLGLIGAGSMIGALPAAFAPAARAEEAAAPVLHEIKMLNKASDDPKKIMVFEPDLVVAKPGDRIKFLATDKSHSAATMKDLIPEGAEPFRSAINEELEYELVRRGGLCHPVHAAHGHGHGHAGSGGRSVVERRNRQGGSPARQGQRAVRRHFRPGRRDSCRIGHDRLIHRQGLDRRRKMLCSPVPTPARLHGQTDKKRTIHPARKRQMTYRLTLSALSFGLALAAAPAIAQDIEAGAKAFNQCQTCHVVQNEAGEVLAGRNAKTGPNLYGLPGRVVGSYEGFKYGESIVAVGAAGQVWDEANFVEYVQDPAAYLKAKLGDDKAKSKMAFKVRSPEDAANLWAFIASLSPAPAADGAAAPAEGEAAPATN